MDLCDFDMGFDLSGEMSFEDRWQEVRPQIEKMVAARNARRAKAQEEAIPEGRKALERQSGS